MDNIQKTLLGVLGVAGFIAFVTPSGDPLAPANSAAETQMAATPAQLNPPPQPAQSAQEVRPEIEVRMGEPTIDGKPMMELPNDAQPNPSSGNNQESSESTSTNNQQYNIPGYTPPSPYVVTPYANSPVIPQPTAPAGNYPSAAAPT